MKELLKNVDWHIGASDELMTKMKGQMEVRGFATGTRSCYLRHVRLLGQHYGRCPSELGLEHVEAYLLYLYREKGLAGQTRNQCAAALRFFFGRTLGRDWTHSVPFARAPKSLPVVLSGTEVERVLAPIESITHRAIATLCYGAGLRVAEACALRIRDVDGKRHLLLIRHASKRGKHRQLPLTPRLHRELRAYYREARPAEPYLFPGNGPALRPITVSAFHQLRWLGRTVRAPTCSSASRTTRRGRSSTRTRASNGRRCARRCRACASSSCARR
jgi:integrase/recombinase XerD